ncbi:MAG: glycosyltransferase [Veillonella dispar]|jgi:hypothetical protein|nr:glycosyltransferase [Veillonella dispar]
MSEIMLSVIMPIYNPGNFLLESLGSVLKQSYKNIEIICVNDGSTDDSLALLKQYQANDDRIKIIDKSNSGYGNTMNYGLKSARGKYIAILEPDDFIDELMYEDLLNIAIENDADVVKSNYFEYTTKNNKSNFFEVLESKPYGKITSAYENDWIMYMRPCIWSAIYRRSMLVENNIVFNETPGASYQDTAFAFKIWTVAKRVVFTKNAYLHYRTDNENSSVKSSGKIFSICDEFQSIQAFLNTNIEYRDKFSKILQVLKLDSYNWNLGRISDEFKPIFRNQMALEFIKADYDGFLDKGYFDSDRWNDLNRLMNDYRVNKSNNSSIINTLKFWKK